MDAATACSLGFALIGAWLLGYRPGCVRFFNFLRILQNQILGPLELLVICWTCWKATIKFYKSKTYHITILHHWFDEWKANDGKFNEIDFIDDVWGWLYWWGFPQQPLFVEGLHCYVQSGSSRLSPLPPTVAASPSASCFPWTFWFSGPLLHTPCRATVEAGLLPEIHASTYVFSSFFRCFIGVKGDLGNWNFRYLSMNNRLTKCIILRNLGGSCLWSWIFHGRWSIWSSHKCLKLVHS